MPKIIRKFSFIALSFLATSIYASNTREIPCPSLSTIQQAAQKIDVAEKDGCLDCPQTTYVAFTSNYDAFKENGFSWSVGVSHLKMNSEKEAVIAGKEMAKNASFQVNSYAVYTGLGSYICEYGPGDVHALGVKFGAN